MSRRGTGTANSVSLFPFLAVLVCVMGSLIFLLLGTLRSLQDDADAQAGTDDAPPFVAEAPIEDPPAEIVAPPTPVAAEPPPRLLEPPTVAPQPATPTGPTLEEVVAEWRKKAEMLDLLRNSRLKQLLRQRYEAAAIQQQVSQLQGTLSQTEASLARTDAALRQHSAAIEDESMQTDLERLLVELRKKLKAAREQAQQVAATEDSEFLVVPFDVQSGTTRRPIYIECTETGLTFHPENITLRPGDLEGFTDRVNPLLAGATALMEYWLAWNQEQPERQPEPYVLLLVRPNGTVGYYIAMRLLGPLRQRFGYELIEADAPLHFPEADPEAVEICQAAIDRLLEQRQQGISSMAVRRGDDGSNAGGGANGRPGRGKPNTRSNSTDDGDNPDSLNPANGRGPRGSKGKSLADREQRIRSTGDKFDVADVEPPQDEEVGNHSWENIDQFQGRDIQQRRLAAKHAKNQPQTPLGRGGPGRKADRSTAATGTGNTEDATTSAATPSTRSGNRAPTEDDEDLDFGDDSPGMAQQSGRPGSRGGATNQHAASGQRPNADEELDLVGDDEYFGGTSASSSARRELRGQPASVTNAAPPKSEVFGDSLARSAFDKSTPVGRTPVDANSASNGSYSSTSDNSSSVGSNGSTNGNPSNRSASKRRSSQASSGSNGGDGDEDEGGEEDDGSSGGTARQKSRSKHQSQAHEPRPKSRYPKLHVDSRFRRWGPHQPGAQIAIERLVIIRADSQVMIVDDESVLRFDENLSAAQTAEQLLETIEQQAENWAEPRDGFYWIPYIQFVISPGGNYHYDQLEPLIKKYGISVVPSQTLRPLDGVEER